ncbi:MAG TPA: hypothetical protein VN765_06760 [Candidatus Acidoferrum sp.]|nr:hypothetical protein [Candidatus Acidoferrum sp.]
MIDLGAPYAGDAGQGRKIEPPTLHLRDHQDHQFYVVLENISSKPIFLYKENGEIRYLSFEITADVGKTVIARRVPYYVDSAYVVEDFQIDPGEVMVVGVNYYPASTPTFPLHYEWPFPIGGQSKKVTIRAVLETEPAGAVAGHEVWSGKAVSKPYEVILKNDSL